jgi:hypothetical protein
MLTRLKWKGIDYPFLIFLVLLTQGNILIKPLAFFIVIFLQQKIPTKIEKNSLGVFYMIMLIYSSFSIFTLNDNIDNSYLLVFALGIIFWALGFLSYLYISDFVKHSSLKSIDATIHAFFVVNLIVCGFQLSKLILLFGGNPFLNQSSGDYVKGIFTNSSVNFIICSFYIFYFFYRKKYAWAAIAALLCLSATYMTGMLILFLVTGYFVITSRRIKLAQRVSIVISGILLLIGFSIASPGNILYAESILSTVTGEHKPRKLVSFIQTFDYVTESPGNFFFGAGMGNFSSRVAFVADGEYVKWYPREYLYRSRDFTKNHFSLWNSNLLFDRTQKGTSNQPFSVYNQMLGEYGVIGLCVLFIYYLGFFFRNYSKLSYAAVLGVLMIGFFTLDYWFEFFSLTVILELMALYDIKTYLENNSSINTPMVTANPEAS